MLQGEDVELNRAKVAILQRVGRLGPTNIGGERHLVASKFHQLQPDEIMRIALGPAGPFRTDVTSVATQEISVLHE